MKTLEQELAEAAPQMLAMLWGYEWLGAAGEMYDPGCGCPECQGTEFSGHVEGCALDALLKKFAALCPKPVDSGAPIK